MPLGKSIKKNIKELVADNHKKGKSLGANGKKRPMKQVIAIAYSAAGKSKSPKQSPKSFWSKATGGRM